MYLVTASAATFPTWSIEAIVWMQQHQRRTVINSQNTVYMHKTQAHKPLTLQDTNTSFYKWNGTSCRDFLYRRTCYLVCSCVHAYKTKPHLTKCQVRSMFTIFLPCETYLKWYQTHKTSDTTTNSSYLLHSSTLQYKYWCLVYTEYKDYAPSVSCR